MFVKITQVEDADIPNRDVCLLPVALLRVSFDMYGFGHSRGKRLVPHHDGESADDVTTLSTGCTRAGCKVSSNIVKVLLLNGRHRLHAEHQL